MERAKEIAAVQSGKYGKLLVSKGYCCKPRWSIGTQADRSPAGRTRFQSLARPAPRAAVSRATWCLTTGTGSGIPATATSAIRACTRWTSPAGRSRTARCPRASGASAAASAVDDQGQTPNTQMAVFDYGDALLRVRSPRPGRQQGPRRLPEQRLERVLHDRRHDSRRQVLQATAATRAKRSPTPKRTSRRAARSAASSHAVRSRKPEDNNANAEVAHYSAALCHLANISYRLGEKASYDKAAGSIGDNKQVVASFDNLRDNLKAVGLNLAETEYQVGRQARRSTPPARSSPAKEPRPPTSC